MTENDLYFELAMEMEGINFEFETNKHGYTAIKCTHKESNKSIVLVGVNIKQIVKEGQGKVGTVNFYPSDIMADIKLSFNKIGIHI